MPKAGSSWLPWGSPIKAGEKGRGRSQEEADPGPAVNARKKGKGRGGSSHRDVVQEVGSVATRLVKVRGSLFICVVFAFIIRLLHK